MLAKHINILILSLMALFGLTLTATAAPQALMLQGGDTAEIRCDGRRLVLERVDKTNVRATCRPANTQPTDTPEPEPSDTPSPEPSDTPIPEPTDESNGLSFDFESYAPGADPDGWLDTAANNSMAEDNDLFQVDDFNGQRVFGTSSTQTNIHSHLMNGELGNFSAYEYTGRMLITAAEGGVGLTFFSQYPQRDAYYRLRRYHNLAFHIEPHGTTMSGRTETNVVPDPNEWYRFRIQVEDTGSRTEVRAKIWPEFQPEPGDWQIDAYDDSSSRLTRGAVGIWSYTAGSKYWDDLTVEPLSSGPGPQPTDPAEPTDTPEPDPSDTPEPEPSDTPEPQPTDPPGPGEDYEIGIDLYELGAIQADIQQGMYDRPCTEEEHDPNRWHLLVSPEHQCHYDHHHGDDPHLVDDIFGPPGEWFNQPDRSISYPWQTFPAQTMYESNEAYAGQMENDLKHEGYGWVVRRNQPCPGENCITDFRLQYHGIFGAHGAVTRFHSYGFEARVCQNPDDPGSCGIVRNGGWADYGRLFTTDQISCGHGVQENYISLPADSLYFPIERPEARDEVRCHPIVTNISNYPDENPLAEWWAHSPGDRVRFQLRSFDPLGNINQSNPAQWQLFCDRDDLNCRYNQSIMTAWIGYVLPVPSSFENISLDQDRDGVTEFVGFTDRWGQPAMNCSEVGLDCIPAEYNNVVLNLYPDENGIPREARYLHHICSDCVRVDYDLSPAGEKWITWFYEYAGR